MHIPTCSVNGLKSKHLEWILHLADPLNRRVLMDLACSQFVHGFDAGEQGDSERRVPPARCASCDRYTRQCDGCECCVGSGQRCQICRLGYVQECTCIHETSICTLGRIDFCCVKSGELVRRNSLVYDL